MFDTEQVKEYLIGKIPNAKCPMCTRPLITSENPKDGVQLEATRVALLHMTGDDYHIQLTQSSGNKATISLELICKNCGYIMLFKADKILEV